MRGYTAATRPTSTRSSAGWASARAPIPSWAATPAAKKSAAYPAANEDASPSHARRCAFATRGHKTPVTHRRRRPRQRKRRAGSSWRTNPPRAWTRTPRIRSWRSWRRRRGRNTAVSSRCCINRGRPSSNGWTTSYSWRRAAGWRTAARRTRCWRTFSPRGTYARHITTRRSF